MLNQIRRLVEPRPRSSKSDTGAAPVLVSLREPISHYYRNMVKIGLGGTGVVYRASRERDGVVIALKAIRLDDLPAAAREIAFSRQMTQCTDREGRELCAFARSYRVLNAPLNSDPGAERALWVEMEYVQGKPLSELVQSIRSKPWTLDRAYQMSLPLLHTTRWFHDHGLLHRDLHADNVLYDATKGKLVFIDFGDACEDRDCHEHDKSWDTLVLNEDTQLLRILYQLVKPNIKLLQQWSAEQTDAQARRYAKAMTQVARGEHVGLESFE